MALPDYEDFQPELASDDDNGVVVKSPETPPLSLGGVFSLLLALELRGALSLAFDRLSCGYWFSVAEEASLNAERTPRAFQGNLRIFTKGSGKHGYDLFNSEDALAAIAGPLPDDALAFEHIQRV